MKTLLFVYMVAQGGWLNLGEIEARYCDASGKAIVEAYVEYSKYKCVLVDEGDD